MVGVQSPSGIWHVELGDLGPWHLVHNLCACLSHHLTVLQLAHPLEVKRCSGGARLVIMPAHKIVFSENFFLKY